MLVRAANYGEDKQLFEAMLHYLKGARRMIQPAEWFVEEHAGCGSAFGLKIKEKLHEEVTPFQKIEIYDTETFGKLMVIDGCYMVTTRDNFLYHEMMIHPALYTHPHPRRVWVVGGGDCGSLREVLKHNTVVEAVQIEIDERVTRLAERYFPELCESNADPRATLLFDDGIQYVAAAAADSVDVIVVDSTDPIGPAEGLFNEAFYRSCITALGKQGILVQQSESPFLHQHLLQTMRDAMRAAGFQYLHTLFFPQPTYPSGWWSATLASATELPEFREAAVRGKAFSTAYYNAEIHRAALAAPEFLRANAAR